jgi:nitrogen fixation/metabolism regulation signal transduction histidine kinase
MYALIDVTDTGKGIAKNQPEQCFQTWIYNQKKGMGIGPLSEQEDN